ncbi:MAG: hypothetical protein ACP5I1_16695, partial [Candidatus Hinthialibacter sp.]
MNTLFPNNHHAPHRPTSRDWTALCLLSILAAASAFLIGRFILQDFPNSADEHAYLFQAQLFAEGRFSAPAHPKQEFLSPFFILTHDGKVFSLFPPGWPLLLSLGVRAGSAALINPLLCGGALFLIFAIGLRLWGKREAWTAVFLTSLSPFFLFTSASYFSHPSCLFSVLLTVYETIALIAAHTLGMLALPLLFDAIAPGVPGSAVALAAQRTWRAMGLGRELDEQVTEHDYD